MDPPRPRLRAWGRTEVSASCPRGGGNRAGGRWNSGGDHVEGSPWRDFAEFFGAEALGGWGYGEKGVRSRDQGEANLLEIEGWGGWGGPKGTLGALMPP